MASSSVTTLFGATFIAVSTVIIVALVLVVAAFSAIVVAVAA